MNNEQAFFTDTFLIVKIVKLSYFLHSKHFVFMLIFLSLAFGAVS